MNSRNRSSRLALVACALFLLALSPKASHAEEVADLSRLVVIGDSISAGFQSGSLIEDFQRTSYGALLARQAEVPLALPLIASPGIPNLLVLEDPGPPPVLGRLPGTSSGRLDPTLQATNLAVPGHDVADVLTTRPDLPVDSPADLVLGIPGLFAGVSRSQIEWAEALAPTTVLVWIGSNDVLGAATAADPSVMTDPETFRAAYDELADRLAATGASVAMANVPDVTVIPFLFPRSEVGFVFGIPDDVLQLALGLDEGDFVTFPGLDLIPPILRGELPGPLPPNVVLTAAESEAVAGRVALFNEIITGAAERTGASLVDVNATLLAADEEGVVLCGRRVSTLPGGGLFSLDLVHPSSTAHAIIANLFADALVEDFGARLAPVDPCPVVERDPYVPQGVSVPAPPRVPAGLLRTR